MDKEWFIELLEDTKAQYGAPQIHNSDQKSQYTNTDYIDELENNEMKDNWTTKEQLWTIFILSGL